MAHVPPPTAYRYTRGFTLIELLVTIAIIGLLATIAVIGLSSARARARARVHAANLSSFNTALGAFYASFEKYPCGDANHGLSGGTWDTSNSAPFLDGEKSGVPLANCIGQPKTGIVTAGLVAAEVMNRLTAGTDATHYGYLVTRNRDSYILYTYFASDPDDLMANDGGNCANAYEFGPGTGTLTPTRLDLVGAPSTDCAP